jgi:TP901 family phage tail tape measure protein
MIEIARLIAYYGANTSEFESKTASVNARISQTGDAFMAFGQKSFIGVTLPLAALGTQAFRTAKDFDTSMNVLRSVTGATEAQFEQLRQKAQELGADLTLPGTSAADAGEAMAELAKAGLSVNNVLAASRGVLQLSAAGQLSNAKAAEITAGALNMFGMEGERASEVADLLAAAANRSSANVTDMGDALRMSGSVAAMAGLEIDELITAIAMMANAGLKGSDAGTSIKQMLLSLQAPSAAASRLMQELGISVYDAQGAMLPMPEIIRQFSAQLGGLTQEQRNAALATIFGSDAVRAANVVLMQGVDAYDAMNAAVTENGAAANLAGAYMQGLNGAIENITSALETAYSAGIEPFNEDLIAMSQAIAEALNAFAELDEGTRRNIVQMLAFAAAVPVASMGIGGLAQGISTAIPLMISMSVNLSKLGTAFNSWNSYVSLTSAMNTQFGAMAVRLGAVGVSITAVAAIWYAWNENITKTQQAGADQVIDAWANRIDSAAQKAQGAGPILEAYATGIERVNAAHEAGGWVADVFVNQQEIVNSGLSTTIGALNEAGLTWDEYSNAVHEAGIMAGYQVDEQGRLYTVVRAGAGLTKQYADELGVLGYQEYQAAARAADLSDKTQQLAAQTRGAAQGVAGLAKETASARDILGALSSSLSTYGVDGDYAQTVTDDLAVALGELSPTMRQLQGDVQMYADALALGLISQDEFTTAMQEAQQGMLSLSDEQRAGLQAMVDTADATREAGQAAVEAAQSYWSLAESLKGASEAEFARKSLEQLSDLMAQEPENIAAYDAAYKDLALSYGFADEKSMALAETLPKLADVMDKIDPSKMSDAISYIFQDAGDGAVDWEAFLQKFELAEEALTPAQTALETTGESISAIGVKAGETGAVIQTEFPLWVKTAEQTSTAIQDAFTKPSWAGVGLSISEGIASGIAKGSGKIEDAAAAAAMAAYDAAMAALDAHSPSRKGMYVGDMFIAGQEIALRDGAETLANAASQSSTAMVDASTQAVSATPTVSTSPTPGAGLSINIENFYGTQQDIDYLVQEIKARL